MVRRIRPEWEPHLGVLITWPHKHSDWADKLPDINATYEQMAYHISRFQMVHIVCYDLELREDIKQRLSQINANLKKISFSIIPTNDTWIRDYGPLTVDIQSDGMQQSTLLNFQFNSWGDKYPYQLDNQVSVKLFQNGVFDQSSMSEADFVLEGGSIDVDGNGTLLTTQACLLNPNRNSKYSQQQIEQTIKNKLGISRILWLNHGQLLGDDTDGHIDTIARFCYQDKIIYNSCKQPNNPHYDSMQRLENELHELNSGLAQPYQLVPCPLPGMKYDKLHTPLPANYVNFLIIRGAVLVPTYNDAADNDALAIIQSCFPDREIIGIDSSTLVKQKGSIHCATMQFG